MEDKKAAIAWKAFRIARNSDIKSFTEHVVGGNLANYIAVSHA